MTYRIEVIEQVSYQGMKHLWASYLATFEGVNKLAAQRHLMYWDEFIEVMHDGKVRKFVAYNEDDEVGAIGTLTNSLKSVPLISPEYFAHKFPDHYEADRIWYTGFLGVDPRRPKSETKHLYAEIVRMMADVIRSNDGIVVVDFCTYNSARKQMPRITSVLLSQGAEHEVKNWKMDAQEFWAFRFDGEDWEDNA